MAIYTYNEVKSIYGMAEIQIVSIKSTFSILVIALPKTQHLQFHICIASPLNSANRVINHSD